MFLFYLDLYEEEKDYTSERKNKLENLLHSLQLDIFGLKLKWTYLSEGGSPSFPSRIQKKISKIFRCDSPWESEEDNPAKMSEGEIGRREGGGREEEGLGREEEGGRKGEEGGVGINDFEFLILISKGAYGRVWMVKRKATGDVYAMKIVNLAEKVC